MKKYQLAAVTSPSVRFECGGHVLDSPVIKNTKKNPNFTENVMFFDIVSNFLFLVAISYIELLLYSSTKNMNICFQDTQLMAV